MHDGAGYHGTVLMAAQPAHPSLAEPAPQPARLGGHRQGPVKRGSCQCGAAVLVVRLRGRVVVLDAREVMPPMRCPLCRIVEARGQDRGPWCWRCGGTGYVGDPLPEPGVCVGVDGQARFFTGTRREGESVHRPHVHE